MGWGEGVFQISSDRDDGRIFLGLKFSIWGFFWGFWVLIFAPIRSSLSLKIRITPRPHRPPCFLLSIRRDLTSGSYTQLLGRGDRNRLIEMMALIQIRFSVIKENDFWDFGK